MTTRHRVDCIEQRMCLLPLLGHRMGKKVRKESETSCKETVRDSCHENLLIFHPFDECSLRVCEAFHVFHVG